VYNERNKKNTTCTFLVTRKKNTITFLKANARAFQDPLIEMQNELIIIVV